MHDRFCRWKQADRRPANPVGHDASRSPGHAWETAPVPSSLLHRLSRRPVSRERNGTESSRRPPHAHRQASTPTMKILAAAGDADSRRQTDDINGQADPAAAARQGHTAFLLTCSLCLQAARVDERARFAVPTGKTGKKKRSVKRSVRRSDRRRRVDSTKGPLVRRHASRDGSVGRTHSLALTVRSAESRGRRPPTSTGRCRRVLVVSYTSAVSLISSFCRPYKLRGKGVSRPRRRTKQTRQQKQVEQRTCCLQPSRHCCRESARLKRGRRHGRQTRGQEIGASQLSLQRAA